LKAGILGRLAHGFAILPPGTSADIEHQTDKVDRYDHNNAEMEPCVRPAIAEMG